MSEPLRSFPISALRRMTDAGIERVARIERAVVAHERGLGKVEMSDVVLRWILGSALIENFPHCVLDFGGVVTLLHDIVLVKHLAEEVSVIDLVQQPGIETLGQSLEPTRAVARERDVERNHVLHFLAMDRA